MRYLCGNDKSFNYNVTRISKEMINIETNKTYFDKDGAFVPKPKINHNIYNIKDVEYNMYLNRGVVIVLSDGPMHTSIIKTIRSLKELYIPNIKVKRGVKNTTQYISVTTKSPMQTEYLYNSQIKPHFNNTNFTWYIFNKMCIHNSPLYVPFLSKPLDQPMQILSLSTIIFDNLNTFNIPDYHLSPDMPLLESYSKHFTQNIYPEKIILHEYYGIHLEIAKHFICNKYKHNQVRKIYKPIYWIKWENLNLYTILATDGSVPYYEQIKHQAFRPIKPDDELKCTMTGIPIYEDCYIFDIYQQCVSADVPIETLPDEIKNGNSVFYNQKVTHNNLTYQDIDLSFATIKKINNKQFVTINKYIEYTEPMHFLISPLAAHQIFKNNGLTEFTNQTKSQIITYRSFCPVRCIDVIHKLPGGDIYHQILISAYKAIIAKRNNGNPPSFNLEGSINNKKIIAIKYLKISDIIEKSRTNYLVVYT